MTDTNSVKITAHRDENNMIHCWFADNNVSPDYERRIEQIETRFFNADSDEEVICRLPRERKRDEPAVIVGEATIEDTDGDGDAPSGSDLSTTFDIDDAVAYLESNGYQPKPFLKEPV